jgi:hypothetical protein
VIAWPVIFISPTFGLLFEGDSGSYISAGHSLAAGKVNS